MHVDSGNKIPVIFLGSGAYAAAAADQRLDLPESPYRLGGFSQNVDATRRSEMYQGIRVYSLEELPPLAATHEAICMLGDCAAKRRFVRQASELGFRFATLIHPGVSGSPAARVGEGAAVIRDVPPGVTVVGNPARVLSGR